MRVTLSCRQLPPFGAVGEERQRERLHGWDRRRCAANLGVGNQSAPRVPTPSTVSASSAPSVRLTTELLRRGYSIHFLRLFGRARSPSPGAVLSHITVSRPSAGTKARACAIMIFVLFAMFRPLSFVSVATGALRAPPLGNTQDTPGNGVGFEDGKGWKCRAQTPRGLQGRCSHGAFGKS